MNKYTAVGLLAAAAEGKRIIVVSPHGRAVRDALTELDQVAPQGMDIRRTNGDQRVIHPSGGDIRFLTRPRLRGKVADVVLVEDDRAIDSDYLQELDAVVHTREHGEIVRY